MSIQDFLLTSNYNNLKMRKQLILKYDSLVRNLAKIVIRKYFSLPITWEDIYVEAMFELPEIYFNYNPLLNDSLNAYLSTHLVYFMRNYCRKWLAKKYEVLNKAIEFNEQLEFIPESKESADSEIWLEKFTEEEKRIITFLVDSGKTYREIAIITHQSNYKLRKIVQEIRLKLK